MAAGSAGIWTCLSWTLGAGGAPFLCGLSSWLPWASQVKQKSIWGVISLARVDFVIWGSMQETKPTLKFFFFPLQGRDLIFQKRETCISFLHKSRKMSGAEMVWNRNAFWWLDVWNQGTDSSCRLREGPLLASGGVSSPGTPQLAGVSLNLCLCHRLALSCLCVQISVLL